MSIHEWAKKTFDKAEKTDIIDHENVFVDNFECAFIYLIDIEGGRK
jgi:hypothetical protein